MMWNGLFVAIVTPFSKDGETVDFAKFEELVQRQVDAGTDGIVVLGTTGESPTLTPEEGVQLIQTAQKVAQGKTKIIAGVSSNNTKSAVSKVREATDLNVDGIMVTAPYYNKPSQEGLFKHYEATAKVTDLPILVYNIPGRTAVNVDLSTTLKLHEAFPHICGIKEASGNFDQITETVGAFRGAEFGVLAGDDSMTLGTMSLGGHGVVSVLANMLPQVMNSLVSYLANDKMDQARNLHFHYLPLMKGLFIGGNPMGIKHLMNEKGIIEDSYRLPLCPMSDAHKSELSGIYKQVMKSVSASEAA